MEKVLRKLSVIIVLLLVIAMCGSFLVLGNQEKNDGNDEVPPSTEQQSFDWSTLHISCLGDSITLGDYLTYSYPRCLQNELGCYAVNNLGINGCTLAQNSSNMERAMCLRYAQIPKDSDIIIVMGGANDRGSIPLGTIDDTDITTYYGALNTLCSGLKENYPNAWIFFMTNFKYDDDDSVNQFDVAKKVYLCDAIKDVCSKHKIDVFDTYSKFTIDGTVDSWDNLHPTQSYVGNYWTPAIARYIKTNYPGKAA